MIKSVRTLVDATHGLKFTESPRWYNNKLWFIDIYDKRIKNVDMEGKVETAVELPFIPNGFGIAPDGTIVVGDAFERKIYRWNGTTLQPWMDLSLVTTFCLSDGIVDNQGRFYVGNIGYNFVDPKAAPVGTCVLAMVKSEGEVTVVADKLFFPNGIVITPDGRTMIVGETIGHRLTAFDIADDGTLSNRRVWAQLPESIGPDGICLDAEGGVWCANPEGTDNVVRVIEGGTVTDRIRVDTHAYALMLGGPERKHLFICTSASHDPAEIHRIPTARFEVVEVNIAGAGTP
ncbi:Virginiamycin B lyase [Pirellula sp. SH-Sr6A]|uniref:SMP-30/gluconolactonase/LRE family protein n=1 Tax=Pirellula sp. SH-Sr6A TaxID=1632865 RepID=UPI00078E68EA|nr:SMP-30/gluconolactonase/LRE family protein [Pirellula sp. SH-Sr6A]AMV32443.1 Virginiamycin B lyase [Pirellula sp. SH-Sr6A]